MFPEEASYTEDSAEISGSTYKSATGEVVSAGCYCKAHGIDEWGQSLKLKGEKAPVHKLLVSAGRTTEAGNDAYLTDAFDTSYLICKGSPVLKEVREAVRRIAEKHKFKGMVPIHKEGKGGGVYTIWLKKTKQSAGAQSLCPADVTQSGSGSRPAPLEEPSGSGARPAQSPGEKERLRLAEKQVRTQASACGSQPAKKATSASGSQPAGKVKNLIQQWEKTEKGKDEWYTPGKSKSGGRRLGRHP